MVLRRTEKLEQIIYWTVITISVCLLAIHMRLLVIRYLKRDFTLITVVQQVDLLSCPVVTLQLDSVRKSEKIPAVEMSFDLGSVPDGFPSWGYAEYHSKRKHSITINTVNYTALLKANLTLNQVRNMFPLKTPYNDGGSIITIIGIAFDETNFIEYQDSDGNSDSITVYISSFDVDSIEPPVGIPFYQMLPGDFINIHISLYQYTLYDRPDSRCRDDYPANIKKLLQIPMPPENLHNAIFAPDLPYDQDTCARLCITNYWLPKCRCYVDENIWMYAGRSENAILCSNLNSNCTAYSSNTSSTVKP